MTPPGSPPALEALDAADVITIGHEPPPYVPLVIDDVGA